MAQRISGGRIRISPWRRWGRQAGVSPSRGFTLLELMIVLAIIIVVSAMAMPSIMTTISAAKVRAGMTDLSGIMQNARTMAVKTNRVKFLQFEVSGSRVLAYVDDAAKPTGPTPAAPTPIPPQFLMPAEFSRADTPGGGCPALTGASMWGGGADPLTAKDKAYFNPLGTPCDYSGTACGAVTGYVYYFSYLQGGGHKWTALGVSAAGRVKSWYCTGGTWGN